MHQRNTRGVIFFMKTPIGMSGQAQIIWN